MKEMATMGGRGCWRRNYGDQSSQMKEAPTKAIPVKGKSMEEDEEEEEGEEETQDG